MSEISQKKLLREKYLAVRSEIDQETRKAAQEEIRRCLFNFSAYRKAEKIYSYVSFGSEADTHEIIRVSLKKGKKVAVPKVMGKGKMEFFFIRDMSDLVPGIWSIPEPSEDCKAAPAPDAATLLLIPGAVFDRLGNRIGYGGGYYDRYLCSYPECRTAALAFSCQCTDYILTDKYDIRVKNIITEKEMIVCRK